MSPRKIKRNLIKIASDEIPKTPTTSSEIIAAYAKEKIKECYGMTKQDGKDPDKLKSKLFFKYAYESKAFSYCIFASDNIISAIEKHIPVERRKYLMDATFKVCPYGIFNQLLIVYIEYLGEVSIH